MSHRFSKWARDAEAQRPLYRVTCNACDETRLTTDPELFKVAHQGAKHYGYPNDFTVKKNTEASDAAPSNG